jgi:hypothetical protein
MPRACLRVYPTYPVRRGHERKRDWSNALSATLTIKTILPRAPNVRVAADEVEEQGCDGSFDPISMRLLARSTSDAFHILLTAFYPNTGSLVGERHFPQSGLTWHAPPGYCRHILFCAVSRRSGAGGVSL